MNAAPTVTGTNPSSRAQGEANQNIAITGTGFVNGGSLGASFGAGINVNSVTYNSPTQLTANISRSRGRPRPDGATSPSRTATAVPRPESASSPCRRVLSSRASRWRTTSGGTAGTDRTGRHHHDHVLDRDEHEHVLLGIGRTTARPLAGEQQRRDRQNRQRRWGRDQRRPLVTATPAGRRLPLREHRSRELELRLQLLRPTRRSGATAPAPSRPSRGPQHAHARDHTRRIAAAACGTVSQQHARLLAPTRTRATPRAASSATTRSPCQPEAVLIATR